MTQSVNASIAKGAVWMLALRFCVKGISIVSIMILARLLTPEDFGLMALATSVYALVELFRAFGFSTALIQKQNASRAHYDSAWTMQVIFSVFASALLFVAASVAADYYGDSRLNGILQVMALIILINGFKNIGIVQFKKRMTFNKEFKYQLLIKISGFCVTIPLAWYLQTYWALLAGMFMGNFSSLILSYVMQNYRPKLCLTEWRELLGFSSWLLLNNVLFFINNHSQNFILGKVSGSNVLGLYSISNEVATMTTNEIVAPINAAAYPGYAKIAHDKEQLKQSYLKVLSSIVLIAVPSAIGIAAIAPLFVPVLLGDKWLEAIPVIQIIALGSIMTSISTNSGYVYLALGKQKITTFIMCFRVSIFLPLLYYLTVSYGVIGAAYSTLLASLVLFPITQTILKKQLGIKWSELTSVLFKPIISAIFMVLAILPILEVPMNQLALMLFAIVLGGAVFLVSMYILWFFMGKKECIEKTMLINIKHRIWKGRSS
tara:strand:+ start:6318 stop:7787 length:1470 start_codon:yes stop_codon:yes gene_type:complete